MSKINEIIKQEFKLRVVEESLNRIIKCLNQLDEREIWYKHNDNTNSIGNLVVHLCGNIQQYIISGLGKTRDTRKRAEEFTENAFRSKEELLKQISETLLRANEIVEAFHPDLYTTNFTIQGFQNTGLSVIIHVIEHLSYHVGQITYYTKWTKGMDLGYYEGQNLDITN